MYSFDHYGSQKIIMSPKLILLAVILAQEDNIMRCIIFFMEYTGKIENCSVSFRSLNALFSWLSSIGSLLIYYSIFLRWIYLDSPDREIRNKLIAEHTIAESQTEST